MDRYPEMDMADSGEMGVPLLDPIEYARTRTPSDFSLLSLRDVGQGAGLRNAESRARWVDAHRGRSEEGSLSGSASASGSAESVGPSEDRAVRGK